jgi:hypothetical protein
MSTSSLRDRFPDKQRLRMSASALSLKASQSSLSLINGRCMSRNASSMSLRSTGRADRKEELREE